MSTNPNLKFELSIALDNEMAFQFIDAKMGGVDFGEGIVNMYPELKAAKTAVGQERRKIIDDFTEKFYTFQKAELKSMINKIRHDWESVEDIFFRQVGKIFNNRAWPQGDYICYLSIFDCNPRFLENKSFQVYYKHRQGPIHVIAHEMLHFMFFDYLSKAESSFRDRIDEHTAWLLSEWFNDLVLALPSFKRFGQQIKDNYPEVEEFAKQFPEFKADSLDIVSFFKAVKTVI